MQPLFARDEAGSRIFAFLEANPRQDPDATTFAMNQNIVFPDGRYEVYLVLLDGSGNVVARTTTSVFMAPTQSASGTSTPDSLLSAISPTE